MPDFTAIALNSTSIQVSWNIALGTPPPPLQCGLFSLKISELNDPLGNNQVQNPPVIQGSNQVGSTVFNGLFPNFEYEFTMDASCQIVNPNGIVASVETYNNNGVPIYCTTMPGAISSLSAIWNNQAHTSITVNWYEATGPNQQNQGVAASVQLVGTGVTHTIVGNNRSSITGLNGSATIAVNPDTYAISVMATNVGGTTSSNSINISPPPAAVTDLNAIWNVPDYNQITVSWTDGLYTTGLNVQLVDAEGHIIPSPVNPEPGQTLTSIFGGVIPEAYTVNVIASNAFGSITTSISVAAPPLPSPVIGLAGGWNAPEYTEITVSWRNGIPTSSIDVQLNVKLTNEGGGGQSYSPPPILVSPPPILVSPPPILVSPPPILVSPPPITVNPSLPGQLQSVPFSGVEPDAYYISVTASNAFGSNPTSIRVEAPPPAAAVIDLSANWNVPEYNEITVNWMNVLATSSLNAQLYVLLTEYGPNGKTYPPIIVNPNPPGHIQSLTIPNVTPGTYNFEIMVIASNDFGSTNTSTTLASPPLPAAVVGLSAIWNATYTEVIISWQLASSGSAPTGYQLTRYAGENPRSLIAQGVNQNPFSSPYMDSPSNITSTNLSQYGLIATNAFGSSLMAMSALLAPPPPPAAPIVTAVPDLTSTAAKPLANVSWVPVPLAVSYQVTIFKTYLGVKTSQVDTRVFTSESTICQEPMVVAGPIPATYQFQVTAINNFGRTASALSDPLVQETSKQSPIHIINK